MTVMFVEVVFYHVFFSVDINILRIHTTSIGSSVQLVLQYCKPVRDTVILFVRL